MSRDQSLYTLTFNPGDGNILKLNENVALGSTGDERYVRLLEKREGEDYAAGLYDALSGARLASAGFVSEKLRSRRLELHGPDEHIPFEFTGKLGFEWTFTFEDNKYKWKRAGATSKDLCCVMKRGGDPDVEVCLYRPGNDSRRSHCQILHYNLERFFGTEIKDVRGLETLLAMSCVCLEDAHNIKHALRNGQPLPAVSRPTQAIQSNTTGRRPSFGNAAPPPVRPPQGANPSGPPVPPKHASPPPPPPPPPQLIETLQEEEDGEVLVGVNTDLEGHINRANRLLADDNVLFIIIRSRQPEAAMRATEVSLGVQRFRHRNMLPELHRYMTEEEDPEPKGPRVIRLDDPPTKQPWTPPKRLAIYLSRIELPDLAPKKPAARPTSSYGSGSKPASPPVSNGGNSGHGLHTPSPNGRLSPSPSGYGGPPSIPPRVPSPGGPSPQPQSHESRFSKLLKPGWR